jgi:hypothetical protein
MQWLTATRIESSQSRQSNKSSPPPTCRSVRAMSVSITGPRSSFSRWTWREVGLSQLASVGVG